MTFSSKNDWRFILRFFTFLIFTCSLALSITVQAQVKFIPGPFADFGNAYTVDSPVRGSLHLTFPASVLPTAQGTVEFWGKLTNFPNAISTAGPNFIANIYPGHTPFVHYRLGIHGNDGAGGSGLIGSVGIATDHFAGGLVDVATGSSTYTGTLGDKDAWHHYALVWNQDGLPDGERVTIFLDGVEAPLSYTLDRAPPAFGDPADYPGQVFGLAVNYEQQGTIAMDNLIIRSTAHLDFSDRFTETPIGDDVVLWNRLGSVAEIESSMIGPGGTLISPIPEPSTYAMLLVGLGLLGFMARRKNIA